MTAKMEGFTSWFTLLFSIGLQCTFFYASQATMIQNEAVHGLLKAGTADFTPSTTKSSSKSSTLFLNSSSTLLYPRGWTIDGETQGLKQLVNFMIAKTMGQHYYLLYDQNTSNGFSTMASILSDATDELARLFESPGDLTVFQYDNELKELEKAIRSYYHVANLRNVFVICTPQNTLNIFQKVLREKLEKPSLHWFVILKENIIKNISINVREGTQLTIALKTANRYDFYASYINKEDKVDFHKIGYWKQNSLTGHLKKPLYQPLRQIYSNFGGRELRSAVINNPPFFHVKFLPDGSIEPIAGIDYQILQTLSEKLNFTLKLVLTEDGQWGGEQPDGSFSGMIGKVSKYEAHLAINEITLTDPRERVVDFTFPYFLESTVLLSPAPAIKNRTFAIFSPFTSQVWFLIALATILVGPIMKFVNWSSFTYIGGKGSKSHSLSTLSFNMFRSLVNQENNLPLPFLCLRVLLIFWLFFCFLIYAFYSGTLTAVLAIPSYEKPINSLVELLEAIQNYNYKAVLVIGSSNEFIFKEASEGIYKDIWEVFDPKVGYAKINDEAMEKVLAGRYVFLTAQLGAEIRAKKLGLKRYYFGRNTFYPQAYGIACANGSPYREVFEGLMIRLWSAGLIGKWKQDEVDKVKGINVEITHGLTAITLAQLQAAFLLLLIGYALGTVTLITEKILNR